MASGRSGSKGKGYKAKGSASTNQNPVQNYNSDRTTSGSCGSGSHPVSSSGTGCAPKDPVSTIRNSTQNNDADGTKRSPSGLSPHSVWGSGNLNLSVGPTIRNPAQNNDANGTACDAFGSSSHTVASSGTERAPSGSSSHTLPSSGTKRAPSGLPPQSVWGSGNLNFAVGEHNVVVPTEGNSISGVPSTTLGSREREPMEVQENPHVVRESKGTTGGAIQGVEGSSGKSAEEPSGPISLRPSLLNNKHKQKVEGSNSVVMDKSLSTSSDYQGYRGNKEEGFDRSRGSRGGRGGSRESHGYQQVEHDRRSGNEGGWNRSRGGRGGGRGEYGSQRGASDRIDAVGRLLSSVLRHRAVELKLNIRSDGYVAVKDLLNLNVKTRAGVPLSSHSVDDIREAVKRDNKQRFSLLEEKSVLLVRANQGHSMELIDSEGLLKPILSAEEVPVCVHGTYLKNLESIKKNGLNRMKRNHVHFARGLSKESGVISGMRGNCEVLIYLDAKKALQDGMKLFVSENGVILTEGFNGVVPPTYFSNIETVEHKRNKRY